MQSLAHVIHHVHGGVFHLNLINFFTHLLFCSTFFLMSIYCKKSKRDWTSSIYIFEILAIISEHFEYARACLRTPA